MSDNPLDKIPQHNRVSIRAVLVRDGEDADAALAKAGFVNAVAIPVMVGEEMDLSGGILGNGVTPNLTAVLETEAEETFDAPQYTQRGPEASAAGGAPPVESGTTTLPAAFGMRPLAPVRKSAG
jgi:hypothetical protein